MVGYHAYKTGFIMPLPLVTESLDSIDEGAKALYVEKDGKFTLDVDLGDGFVPKSEVEGLKQNHDKLLSEKKEAKRKADEAAAEARRIAEENAAKNGDLESLKKSWAEKENGYKEKLSLFEQKEAKFEISKAANGIVADLAEGANAELLSEFVSKRLKYEGGEVKVVDSNGNLTISSLDELKQEFKSNEKYASLLKGTGSSGSRASSTEKTGGADDKTVTRSEFDSMSHEKRAEFSKSGGKVVD